MWISLHPLHGLLVEEMLLFQSLIDLIISVIEFYFQQF